MNPVADNPSLPSSPVPPPTPPLVIGLEPWLPWPLSSWQWWTRPIRAERLAVLRIGLCAVLLVDILTSYRAYLDDFFATGGLGSPELFAYYGDAPKMFWSLLRGFGDPPLATLTLGAWLILTAWLVFDFWARRAVGRPLVPPDQGKMGLPRSPLSYWDLAGWLTSGVLLVLGIWARGLKEESDTSLCWQAPVVLVAITVLLFLLEFAQRCRRENPSRIRLAWLTAALGTFTFLSVAGGLLPFADWAAERDYSLGHRLLRSWQEDEILLQGALWTWVAAVALLLVGCFTRTAAVIAWVLSTSFANVNPYIDNAGDTVRGIILFYLMLCPCGAAWSLDRCWRRWRGEGAGPVYVWPWPLRLLFLQMVFIYFLNGLYKLTGSDWIDGNSLYYVLCDVSLARFSFAQLQLPYWFTQIMAWTVLVWEISFPLLVALRWTRTLALFFGAAFHLGIWGSLELGGFGPYMLCLYLPLLPWDKWLKDRGTTSGG